MFRLARVRIPTIAPRFAQFNRFYSNKLTAGSFVAEYGKPDVRYTENHEWIAAFEDSNAFVGITKYAADALGDTTFVEVVDDETEVDKDDAIGSVESVKSASDLYSPVSGIVVQSNQQLVEDPSLVNDDPMGAAWFAKIKINDAKDLDQLMSYEQYEEFIKKDE